MRLLDRYIYTLTDSLCLTVMRRNAAGRAMKNRKNMKELLAHIQESAVCWDTEFEAWEAGLILVAIHVRSQVPAELSD